MGNTANIEALGLKETRLDGSSSQSKEISGSALDLMKEGQELQLVKPDTATAVLPNVRASAHVGDSSLYPDPSLTPGAVFPNVTESDVCTPGYSKTVRNVSAQTKAEVFREYGITPEPGKYEIDHFISLELGGSNDISNLWPEPYDPRPGAHEKDSVENYLHAQVCSGAMTLKQAQDAISTDWYKVYLQSHK